MDLDNRNDFTCLPQDPRAATKHILDKMLNEIHPLVLKIRKLSSSWGENEDGTHKIRNVYTLCLSQIKKCVLNLFEVFRLECNSRILLQETRQCNLERLSWCVNRLVSIDNYLNKKSLNKAHCEDDSSNSNESFNVTVMYFVNWIDHTFEVLTKLSETVYKTDYKENEELGQHWKCDMVECIRELHVSIDELLLSAMTLYRYCLSHDQLIVKARCQVVLRETKALLGELIEGELSTTETSTESLKLPVMPTNINVRIDVLKDVLYALETNTNTALLTLLIYCFSTNLSAVDILKQHFITAKEMCQCIAENNDGEDCTFVRDFDLYNERLLQIGSFAVSCSSDQHRILNLRSGLASLESLDPHLVPALMTSPNSHHSALLVESWRREIKEIRDSVFLIVDPTAFADKSKQMMHQQLLETLKETSYNYANVCAVINTGIVLYDFFAVYNEMEPLALSHRDGLIPLLADLNKAISECKVVSNLLCTNEDFQYEVSKSSQKQVTLDKLYKRLKLLYSIVSKINTLHQPKDLFEDEAPQNLTRTIVKNDQTYLKPQQKANLSKSLFARTNVRSSTRNFPLSKLTKHLRGKNCSQLNFSVELDRIFNLSSEKMSQSVENSGSNGKVKNKFLDRARETSLYNFSPIKNRSSMRKTVLSRHLATFTKNGNNMPLSVGETQSLMDENESLQFTEVLNQINDTTNILITTKRGFSSQTANDTNTLRINVCQNITNTKNHDIFKDSDSNNIWKISMNSVDEPTTMRQANETSSLSNMTQPSNINTFERINDLEFVETKLNSLKSQFETSL